MKPFLLGIIAGLIAVAIFCGIYSLGYESGKHEGMKYHTFFFRATSTPETNQISGGYTLPNKSENKI